MADKPLKLFIPGPTEVVPAVLQAQAKPMIGHRMPQFSDLYRRLIPPLQRLLKTKEPVFLSTSGATGIMEGAIRNLVGRRCLNLVCGAFSKRWHQITLANGKEADQLAVDWGKAIKPEMVDEALAGGRYDAVTLVHNETSTGVMNPLAEIAAVVKRHPDVLLLVDAVSSMAGVEIPVDELGLDLILAGTQKAFALPPGLTVFCASPRAMERAATIMDRGTYFDFLDFRKYHDRDQTPNTPAISLLNALDCQLQRMEAEGLAARFQRHKEMAGIVRQWAREHFALFAEPGYESLTLTTVDNTRGISVKDLNAFLSERGAIISNGYGPLKEKTFRIAHMGDLTPVEVREVLGWIDQFLE